MPLLPPASGSQRTFLVAAAAFLLVAPFPSSAGWRVFFLLLTAAVLLWRRWRLDEAWGLALLPRAFAVAALAWSLACVASLAWSVDPGYTLQELRRELLYDAIAFVVFFAGTRRAEELALWMRALIAAALVLGVCQWMHALFPRSAWADSISVSPGPFATHIAMVVPLVAIAAWPRPNGLGWRLPAAIAVCVALLFLGLAGESRILWVALIAAALVAFALFVAGLPRGGRARALATRAFLAGLVLLIALMALSTESKFSVYPGARSTYEMLTLDERPIIWKIAAAKVQDAPLLGHGYGRDIVGDDLRRELQRASVLPYNHAHSVFLDVALQLGAVGLAIFVAMMGALAVALFAGRRTAAGMPLAIAGLALMTAYAFKNVTDDFYFRTNSLLFWAVMGMLLGRAARARQEA